MKITQVQTTSKENLLVLTIAESPKDKNFKRYLTSLSREPSTSFNQLLMKEVTVEKSPGSNCDFTITVTSEKSSTILTATKFFSFQALPLPGDKGITCSLL